MGKQNCVLDLHFQPQSRSRFRAVEFENSGEILRKIICKKFPWMAQLWSRHQKKKLFIIYIIYMHIYAYMHFLEVCFHYDKISETVPCCCHLKFASQMISHGNQAILIWRLKDDKESILCGWFPKAFDIEASKTQKKNNSGSILPFYKARQKR